MNFNRYNSKKCKCGKATSVLARPTGRLGKFGDYGRTVFETDTGATLHSCLAGHDESAVIAACRGRGAQRIARKVLGRVVNDIKCDGRCESATGHSCDCQCGGKNHGMRHAA